MQNVAGESRLSHAPNGLVVLVLVAALSLAGCSVTMPAPQGLTAAPEVAVAYNRAAGFSVGVVPETVPPIKLGEALRFVLSSSATGYGHLYLLNASGGVLVLEENRYLPANARVLFPPPRTDYALRATPPVGIERVLFLVTRQPLLGVLSGKDEIGPVQLPMAAPAFIHQLNAKTSALPADSWALAEARVEIVDQ